MLVSSHRGFGPGSPRQTGGLSMLRVAVSQLTTHFRRFVAIGLAIAALSALLFASSPVFARRGVRPLFEPTDLELEKTGTLDIDVQTGVIRSQGPARVVVDIEGDEVGLCDLPELGKGFLLR